MTLQHLSVRGNDHTGFDRVLSLQMALNTADSTDQPKLVNSSKVTKISDAV